MAIPRTPRDPFSFLFQEILIHPSGRANKPLNVTSNVAELELYENINELSIHGSMTIIDTDSIVANVDVQGSELVTVKIMIPDSPDTSFIRSFRISKILDTSQGSDNVEAYTFQLVDEDTYKNTLHNVSRAYTGTTSEIIRNILIEFFPGKALGSSFRGEGRDPLLVGPKPIQGKIKYIVPNINPYQAIKVLANRSTGPTGTPFYAFGTLCDRKIRFFDLKDLLGLEPPINQSRSGGQRVPQQSYTYSAAGANDPAIATDHGMSFVISRLDTRETEDMLSLINEGDVGATYEYINTTGGYIDEYHHQATKMFERVWGRTPTQAPLAPVFDPLAEVGGKYLSDYKSINISAIAASDIFDQADVSSLNEDMTDIYHRSKSTGKALRHFTRKNALHIEVPGRNFFPVIPEKNMTISNKINIKVLANRDVKGTDPQYSVLDRKKSGDYIILATKHVFNSVSGKYSCVHKLGKLGNVSGNTRIEQ